MTGYTLSAVDLSIGEALLTLSPLTLPPSKRLMVATQSSWTACFDNGTRGTDLLSFMTVLTDRLRCEGLILHCANDRRMYANRDQHNHFTNLGFEYFRPVGEASIGPERAVSLSQYYGKWKFAAAGPPLPAEDLSRYEMTSTRSRLTLDMLDSYCRSLGLSPFNPEFYLPHGYLADSYTNGTTRYAATLSLHEAGAVFSQGIG